MLSLAVILGLAAWSAVFWLVVPPSLRKMTLLALSLVLLFSLQPAVNDTGAGFILPSVTVLMVIGVAWIVQPPEHPLRVMAITCIVAAAIGVIIYFVPQTALILTTARAIILHGEQRELLLIVPTVILLIVVAIRAVPTAVTHGCTWAVVPVSVAVLFIIAGRGVFDDSGPARLNLLVFWNDLPNGQANLFVPALVLVAVPFFGAPLLRSRVIWRRRLALIWLPILIALLYVFKIEGGRSAFDAIYANGRLDLQWLGLSYVAFRLLHVVIDFRLGQVKPPFTLTDFMLYVLLFPTVVSGPITRLEKIVPQFAAFCEPYRLSNLIQGSGRLIRGLFRKFVVADLLAKVALQPSLFPEAPFAESSRVALLIMLYAAFLVFFFDFAGYSDIAIGLGRLYGLQLPENFNRPLSRPNIAQFWSSWHITLSDWFRIYWFTPLSRVLLRTPLRRVQTVIILLAQLSTMVLIGLWHAVSPTWALWGLWNGLGLWGYKMIADNTRGWFADRTQNVRVARIAQAVNVFITFHYVMISFSFVAFSDLASVSRFWSALLGFGR